MTTEQIMAVAKAISNMDDNTSFGSVISKFDVLSRRNELFYFCNFWYCIPKKYLYENYKHYLSVSECGCNYSDFFKQDILEEIQKVNQHDTVDNLSLQSLLDDKGYLTIYHGHCKPTMRGSHSWTLDKDIAVFFGQRNALFSGIEDFYVVSGKVKLEDIISFIEDRNEQEIVVLQKNVKNKVKSFFNDEDEAVKLAIEKHRQRLEENQKNIIEEFAKEQVN